MSESLHGVPASLERQEAVRKMRDHLDLQVRFAEAVARVAGMPLTRALRQCTGLPFHSISTTAEVSFEKKWKELSTDIDQKRDHEYVVARVAAFLGTAWLRPPDRDFAQEAFWPFHYTYDREEKTIHPHFGAMTFDPDQQPGEPGWLDEERRDEMRKKLQEMFLQIKQQHPEAESVEGRSWLYNLDSYKKLFPASYVDSEVEVPAGDFRRGEWWGEFRSRDGSVNVRRKETFLKNLESLTYNHLEAAFPLRPLVVRAPIKDFYEEYGIK